MMASSSTLEMLPDELLLEVCKYLLCIDVLQSFVGLNKRMTSLIRDYRHHVSLHKGSYGQSAYFYVNVLPKIGSDVRTLVIDRLYSVLQDVMFHRRFSDQRLPTIFPKLKKVTLVAFNSETLLPTINMLEGFEHLVQLDIRSLFPIPHEHQPAVLDALLKANNQKMSSVLIEHCWSPLRLETLSNVLYSNITNLQITMATLDDFSLLFSAIPNVIQLNVVITDKNPSVLFNSDTPSLVHLTKFRLASVRRPWSVEDLTAILHRMPSIESLSLQLFTYDNRLVDGQQILFLQQSLHHIQQFNYGIFYIVERDQFDRETILASWLPSAIECLVDETTIVDGIYVYIHTLLPFSEPFTSLKLPGAMISKAMPSKDCNRQIEQLIINSVSTFVNCLPVLTCWSHAKELLIWFSNTDPTATADTGQKQQQQQQKQTLVFPKMVRLRDLTFDGPVPSDLDHFSLVFAAASNLIRLDLNFDSLLPLLYNDEARRFFQQRITALAINKISSSTSTVITEQHVSRLASTFPRLRHMFVDLTHSLPNIDSMVLSILTEFKKRLVSLGIDGPPSDEMKADARKWLEENNNKSNHNIVHPTDFDAYFNVESNELVVWM